MMRPNSTYIVGIFACLLLTACGLQFKPLTLNNAYVSSADGAYSESFGAEEAFANFTANLIFQDKTGDVWGVEVDECKNISIATDVRYEGEKSLKVRWNKPAGGCPWVGMGFGWDGWRGKQLGDVVPYAAIQAKIRTVKGKMNDLPFVFLLEDYTETQTGLGFSASMVEKMPISEEWQTLTVPLSSFNFDGDEVDAYNIKQLLIEMNGTGSVYLDDIRIVPYKGTAPAAKTAPVVAEGKSPYRSFKNFYATDIYVNNSGDAWGIVDDGCKDVKFIAENTHSGSQAIELNWSRSTEGCGWTGIGFGWNSWAPKDLSAIQDKAAIQMFVRAPEGKRLYGLPLVALLEDYGGKQTGALFSQRYFENFPIEDEWTKVVLPISDFALDKYPVNMASIKQLQFELLGDGHLYVDDIGIIPFDKPADATPEKTVTPFIDQVPVTLFDSQFVNGNGWGLTKDQCRTFVLKTEENSSEKLLSLEWKAKDSYPCNWIELGVSWNKWEPVDITQNYNAVNLTFFLNYTEFPEIMAGVENYQFQKSLVQVKPAHTQPLKRDNWYKVTIPLSELVVAHPEHNYTNVKQILFSFKGEGTALMDNIKLETTK